MKDDRAFPLHMLDAIDQITQYTCDGRDAFFADSRTQDAVIRNLEIIGEAAKCISSALKDHYQEIPWKQIGGMRNKLIHEYFGVEMLLVWEVVQSELPRLRESVESMLSATA